MELHNLNDSDHPIRPWRLGKWRLQREDAFFGLGEPIALIGGAALGEKEPGWVVGIAPDYGPHGEDMTKAHAVLIQHAPIMYETLDSISLVLEAALAKIGSGNVEGAVTDIMAAREWSLSAQEQANPC